MAEELSLSQLRDSKKRKSNDKWNVVSSPAAKKFKISSSLNGCNGEWTNSDDRKRASAQVKLGRQAAKVPGRVARDAVISYVPAPLQGLARSGLKQVEKKVEKKLKKFFGMGAYTGMGAYSGMGGYGQKRVSNALIRSSSSTPSTISRIRSVNDETGRVIMSRREYAIDIYAPSSSEFVTSLKVGVNPGLAVFPWLSQVAINYDKFRPRKIVWIYRPNVLVSTTGAVPSLMMACVYNSGSPSFTSKFAMLEYDGVVDGRVTDEVICGMECDPRKIGDSWFTIRSGKVPAGQDVKTYDPAFLQIAINGSSTANYPSGTILGELWVEYEFELAAPKAYENLGASIYRDAFYGVTGVAALLPLGTAPLADSLNSIGGTINKSGASGSQYTFPDNFQGYVSVKVNITASAITATLNTFLFILNTVANGSRITAVGDLSDAAGTPTWYDGLFGSTAGGCVVYHLYVQPARISGANVIVIGASSMTATFCSMEITQYTPNRSDMFSGTMTAVSNSLSPYVAVIGYTPV